MGADSDGNICVPWTDPACPTPSATSGDQGIGGGLDPGPGGNGISNVPWTDAVVPVPSNMDGSGPFGNPSKFASVDGSTHEGESLLGDITMPPMHTVDEQ